MKDIIIIGAGGHASVIIDIIECMKNNGHQVRIKGLLDDSKDKTHFMGYKILDEVKNAYLYNDNDTEFVIAIGSNEVRKSIAKKSPNLKYFIAIHPTAIIGSNVAINEGTVVMPRAIINANTTIGKHAIINSGAIVEHDNKIKDFVHISPGSTLAGGVEVGESTQVGANSTIIPLIKIGCNSIIGAGSTVIRNIESEVVAVGTPCKVIRHI